MRILAVDSSSITASVAVFDNREKLAEGFINNGLTHSQTLMPLISETLAGSAIDIDTIDVFAASIGPGSFTGLRIGISLIKGMAALKNKPCIGVSTLAALAYGAIEFGGIVCAVMDARCAQVYNALFSTENGEFTRLCEDRTISIEDLLAELIKINKPIILVGDGAFMCYNIYREKTHSIVLADESQVYLHGSSVALLAVKQANPLPANELVPIYLQLPQAERELKRKSENK